MIRRSPTSPNDAFVRDRATWLAYLSLGCFAVLEAGLGPLMPFLRADLGFGYGLASLHFSAFAFGIVLVGVVGEQAARRWGGVGGLMAGALLLVLAPAPAVSIGAVLAMRACGGLLAVTIQANLAERRGPSRAIAIAELNLAASTCAALSTVVNWLGRAAVHALVLILCFLTLPPLLLYALAQKQIIETFVTSGIKG